MSVPARRDDLIDLEGYHSAQVHAEVRLNTNESPFTPSRAYVDALEDAVAGISLNRYPDRSALALRTSIARLEGVEPEEVFCANGSNEVLQSLLLAFGGAARRALVFEPSYTLHSHIARITATEVALRQRDEEFKISEAELRAAIGAEQPVITFLCSPNNPTGLSEPLGNVRAALDAGDGLVVVDEAYGQFAPASAASLRGEPGAERLVVVRTFSKTWALAGVRLGYAIAHPAVVDACFSVVLPYHLSSLTQAAGLAALGFGEEMTGHVALLIAERTRVHEALENLAVELWPSESNFILFRPTRVPVSEVWAGLLERSVLVRDCSSWRRLEGCLRVTIGSPEENDRFLAALKEIA
jgi:histidinol-phosphate aminotransferase